MDEKRMHKLGLALMVQFIFCISNAQISWPSDQILPSFPLPGQTQDLIYLNGSLSDDELYFFASLKGIVNRTQPRIFSYEGDAYAEGQYTWLQSLSLSWNEYSDPWSLLPKYMSEISGLIIYDPNQIHTVNLATTMANGLNAVIVSPTLAETLSEPPYNLPVLEDLQGVFSSKLQVYETLYNEYWPNIDKRLLLGLDPTSHKAALREYATSLGAAVIWLDPEIIDESALLNNFLSSMPVGANYMGWWPEEGAGVSRGSAYGVGTIASDWCSNLTLHSGTSRKVNLKDIPEKPTLENKIYVAFILSDGDNLQYVEHLMRKLWNNPDRGSVPIGWTVSPAMMDAMPGALNYYWQTATDNDMLISGPSGLAYVYPNDFVDQSELEQFVVRTEDYTKRAGLRVITIWNTITGGIDQNVGEAYADYAPSILGLTSQNTSDGLTVYNNSLPGMGLACNYCWDEATMESAISERAAGWDGSEPRFVIIQSQPWQNARPTTFKNVANSLNSNYEVVRPDHLFQLLREYHGMEDPTNVSIGDANNFESSSLSVSPNPCKDDVNVCFTKGLFDQLKVIDQKGKEIISMNIPYDSCEIILNIEAFKKGTYVIQVSGEKVQENRKIIK
ncbi:T9SS type A sorting domain-containing protein [Plebeiibacterium sediminum]|uniref:GxGYxYP family putative glycoside hydrolase n=1 Tax=Plebeiibacterium sediminum TaxID=2992112 RepID=A0AAE3M684_9BACT|nr:GxGYxYP domain-containing protein [Plebeiobacterium sediminum]MCW3787934.1 GxGYxYP family putative glycoside hydrolase [Plebeiobacterium sediminum]